MNGFQTTITLRMKLCIEYGARGYIFADVFIPTITLSKDVFCYSPIVYDKYLNWIQLSNWGRSNLN